VSGLKRKPAEAHGGGRTVTLEIAARVRDAAQEEPKQ